MTDTIKILLDTDIGGDIDDAVCLAYLLKEPRCELLGITTVCGESEKRAAVADALCKAADKDIPIVAGLDTSLQPIPCYPTPDGAKALKNWRHNHYEKGDAPAFLYQQIKRHPHEVVLIGIGNMTNIATLFLKHPDAVSLLRGLYMMNGYFGRKPLPDPAYNWNAWADPLASKIVYDAAVETHRSVPLEITEQLTLQAEQTDMLLKADSPLMCAVLDFGKAWQISSGKLTLHDPLAAVCVFHPEVCTFEHGKVAVETEKKEHLGNTVFTPDECGNAEIARTVNKETFYRILRDTLCDKRFVLPPRVVDRAKSAGRAGEAWLDSLDTVVAELENKWHISVGQPLTGGSHAFVAYADGERGERYTLKIDMPETLGGEFAASVSAMKLFDGRGYVRLFACDEERQACLMERLGKRVGELGLPVREQLKIICDTLQESWRTPVPESHSFPQGRESIDWFRGFYEETYELLNHPCSEKVMNTVYAFLQSRESAFAPSEWVLLHGDAHADNVLQNLSGEGYKLIDGGGIVYEKAYDLGVPMREWIDDYYPNPAERVRERSKYLHELTGVPERAIYEWGFLQTVSTAFVLLQTGRKDLGHKMLDTAEIWAAKENGRSGLARCVAREYGLLHAAENMLGGIQISIREYRPSDCEELTKLFYNTVHTVNAKDYTKEQLDAWATGRVDSEKWNRSFLEHCSAIAVHDGRIVGFGDIDKTGYLDRLFVHADYQKRGIATEICDYLEQTVQGSITTHASITARPFFEKRGYKVVKEQQAERQGIYLTYFIMKKER